MAMNFIKPSEISSRIMSLLEEADHWVVLVSPYMRISRWYKLQNKINELKDRRIDLEVYVREDPENYTTYQDLDQLELGYQKIPKLHSKLYMNERKAIISSMNLLLSSEINSLEIGFETENRDEYQVLFSYLERYILGRKNEHPAKLTGESKTEQYAFMSRIKEQLWENKTNAWPWMADHQLHISTGRMNYRVIIDHGRMEIKAIQSKAYTRGQSFLPETASLAQKLSKLTSMQVHMGTSLVEQSQVIQGVSKHPLKSPNITQILNSETGSMLDIIQSFILSVEEEMDP